MLFSSDGALKYTCGLTPIFCLRIFSWTRNSAFYNSKAAQSLLQSLLSGAVSMRRKSSAGPSRVGSTLAFSRSFHFFASPATSKRNLYVSNEASLLYSGGFTLVFRTKTSIHGFLHFALILSLLVFLHFSYDFLFRLSSLVSSVLDLLSCLASFAVYPLLTGIYCSSRLTQLTLNSRLLAMSKLSILFWYLYLIKAFQMLCIWFLTPVVIEFKFGKLWVLFSLYLCSRTDIQ